MVMRLLKDKDTCCELFNSLNKCFKQCQLHRRLSVCALYLAHVSCTNFESGMYLVLTLNLAFILRDSEAALLISVNTRTASGLGWGEKMA